MLHIFYGIAQNYIDITDQVFTKCSDGTRLYIPGGDSLRAEMFSDPAYRTVKNIVVFREQNLERTCSVFGPQAEVRIELTPEESRTQHPPQRVSEDRGMPPKPPQTIKEKVAFIHQNLRFAGGDLTEELPEQKMIARYVDPKATVLELGANIGRSTLMIASVLEDSSKLVTLECNPVSAEMLKNNKFANGFEFHVEPAALSYRKLIQRGWETIPSEELLPGHSWITTITFEELMRKYGLNFNTLVADCEGALYYIFKDSTALLENIDTVVLEADFRSVEQKREVESVFRRFGLEKVYSEPLVVDWQHPFPDECVESFFEVWKKQV